VVSITREDSEQPYKIKQDVQKLARNMPFGTPLLHAERQDQGRAKTLAFRPMKLDTAKAQACPCNRA
jgi:hypothetical protein